MTLQKSIRDAIHSVNKDQALSDVRTVDQIKEQALAPNRVQSTLMGIFGTVALLLSGIGIYGVISYSVAQRTHEIGIRAALGASAGSLLRLIVSRGLVLALIGLVIGVGGALGLTRVMERLLMRRRSARPDDNVVSRGGPRRRRRQRVLHPGSTRDQGRPARRSAARVGWTQAGHSNTTVTLLFASRTSRTPPARSSTTTLSKLPVARCLT